MTTTGAVAASAAVEAGADPSSMRSAQFVREAHGIVRDLLPARPRRYFSDFLITIVVAYGALVVYLWAPTFSATQSAAFIVCGLGMYRAVAFTHEIAHRRAGTFVEFTWIWNVLCGVPFFVPSFLYGDHQGHHSSQAYGTRADPEYILRSRRWRTRVVVFLLVPLLYPLLAFVRFLVLTPVALLSTLGDRLVWTFASSLYVMNESYRREYDAAALTTSRWALELASSAWAWVVTLLVVTDRLPLAVLFKVYLVTLLWVAINQVRTLVAHRYTSDPDSPGSYFDQLLDTNTFPHGKWLPALWAPVGLRYHALHHLLPMLPYHAMHDAHCRLMARLPPDSPYHQTIRRGFWPVLREMLRNRERPAHAPSSAIAATPTGGRPSCR